MWRARLRVFVGLPLLKGFLIKMWEAFTLSYPNDMVVVIALCFVLAGLVKGTIGMGMPAILMVTLTLFIPPIEAIPIIVLPMLFVNVFQFLRGPQPKAIARKYAVFVWAMAAVMAVTAYNIRWFPEAVLLTSIGVAMILFAVPSLFGWRFPVGPNPLWQVLAGGTAGVIGGLSSVWSPPVVMYLMGRDVGKDEFIGAIGFIFMIGSVTLALALGSIQLLTVDIILPSVVGLALTMIGFRTGEIIRQHINLEMFRRLVLMAFLIMGGRLVLISFF